MMTQSSIYTIESKAEDFPDRLRHIPTAPQRLYVQGSGFAELRKRPCVAVVGSRKLTAYGKAITAKLVRELAQAGVAIVSGLAIGVDGVAHQAALDADGLTVAVLAGGLDKIHPSSHYQLALHIMHQGGALVSEYAPGTPPYRGSFIARNRIVSGLAHALLITEATEHSGTLHTARFALEQGRDVLVVPGNVTSEASAGTNNLLKTGATPVTCADDVLYSLGMQPSDASTTAAKGNTPEEQAILDALATGESDATYLIEQSKLDVIQFNQALTMLEITGKIRSLGANHWGLC